MDSALDSLGESIARRCGVIRTRQIGERTTLLLLRLRYHLLTRAADGIERALLAEDCQLAAFTGAPNVARWLPDEEARALVDATPDGNVPPDIAGEFLRRVIDGMAEVQPELEALARRRGEALLQAHRRVRTAARLRGVQQWVEPQLPVDILGAYIYLPTLAGGR
jgi:hypothetical protein